MNSKIIIAVIAAILIMIVGLFFFNKGNSNTNTNVQNLENSQQAPRNTQTNTNTNTETNTDNPQEYQITIEGFAFSSSTLTIKQGDIVTWTNQDTAKHTVTSDSGSELDSSLLAKSATYSHTFTEVGTFSYHCTPHPSMKAKIIVQ